MAEVVSGVAKGRKLNGGPVREVPYLRVANVQAGFLDLSEIKTIPAKQSEVDALALERGDVVMTEGGDYDKLGRGALWDQDLPDCIHQNHVFRVRTNREQLLPTFFVHYLQTQVRHELLSSLCKEDNKSGQHQYDAATGPSCAARSPRTPKEVRQRIGDDSRGGLPATGLRQGGC